MILNNRWLHYGFHVISYDVVWLILILKASTTYSALSCFAALAIVATQLIWQVLKRHTQGLYLFLFMFWLAGLIGDGLLSFFGWISFPSSAYFNLNWPTFIPPLFMQILWLCLAVTLYATFIQLLNHQFILLVLSALSFPFAYYVGSILDAGFLNHGLKSLWAIGIVYAILMPLTAYVYTELRKIHDH